MGTRLEPLSESTHGQRLTPRPAFRLRNGATVRGDGHDTVDRQKSGDFSVQIDTSSKLRRRQPSLGQRRETGAVSENCPARLCGTWDLLNCRGDDSPNQPCVKDQHTFCREIACFVCTGLISAHAQKQRNRPQGTVPRQDFLCVASDALAVLDAARVRVLPLDRLHHETLADGASGGLDAHRSAALDDRDRLEVRLEGAALARRRLDADAAKILRLTAILADPT